jgi:hypothetical protein
MSMNNFKKTCATGLGMLLSVGILSGIGFDASAATCSTPISPAAGSLALLPTTTRVTLSCAGAGSASVESLGTANNTAVSVRLISGSLGSVAGYNSARAVIATCIVNDSSPAGGAIVSPGSCVGAVFKDVFGNG